MPTYIMSKSDGGTALGRRDKYIQKLNGYTKIGSILKMDN
jgi:hypothetical protein